MGEFHGLGSFHSQSVESEALRTLPTGQAQKAAHAPLASAERPKPQPTKDHAAAKAAATINDGRKGP
jgi:hypothetical protein